MTTTGREGFDWSRGRWVNAVVPQAQAAIVIASDWAPIRAFDEIVAHSPEAVYGDVLPVLRQGDLRIVNLECALSADASPVWKSGSVFKGRPVHVNGLTAVPFEVATLANNHVFDYGPEAFRQTLNLLSENSIRPVGAGMSAEEARRPLILDLNGVRIGIVNFSEGEDLTSAVSGPGVFGWDVDAVVESVRAIRPGVNIILVICHGGVEYIPFPPPYLASAFRRIAEAGADLIIGHHPHVPQGVHICNGVPICYSLGNFVFYQETDLFYRKLGYLVKAGVSRAGLAHIHLIPYEIGPECLRLLKGDESAQLFESLKKVSLPLVNAEGVTEAWHGFLRCYGLKGFRDEIAMILAKMDQEPAKGAAMLRNRVATMQHREHWIDAMTRIMDGTIDDSPSWACDLAVEWLTRNGLQGERVEMNAAAKDSLSLVIADSGMGGLSICADIVNGLQARRSYRSVSLTYFNAWPEQDRGYNLLPGMAERIRVFDRALGAMLRFGPDRILIACNTLSALYAHTPFSRQAPVPVVGIIDFGVDLVYAHLSALADSRVIILGTPTTIEAGAHRTRLVERGIPAERIICQSCDRLAGEIEKAPEGATVRAMVESCIRQAAERIPDRRRPVAAALCCTHYGYSESIFDAAMRASFEGPVAILNPNKAMSEALLADFAPQGRQDVRIDVKVVSRIVWTDEKIAAIARLLETESPLTADALRQYRHDPDLFTF